jgi:hypothetical protein
VIRVASALLYTMLFALRCSFSSLSFCHRDLGFPGGAGAGICSADASECRGSGCKVHDVPDCEDMARKPEIIFLLGETRTSDVAGTGTRDVIKGSIALSGYRER